MRKATPPAGWAEDDRHGRSLTARLIRRSALPGEAPSPESIAMVKACLLDWIGVTMAGAASAEIDLLVAEALEDGPAAQPLIGRAERVGLRDAVLINGVAGHVLDYDDGLAAMMGHASVPILPALLGVTRQHPVTGMQLIEAILVAVEMAGCVGQLVAPSHYDRGFHATATIGAMAAARGCACLLGLDIEATARAVGLAAARAAGLKASFGSAAKPVQAGWSALVGFTAARWAAGGMTAPPDGLGDAQGFVATHAQASAIEAALAPAPGGAHILGTQFKRYASCGVTHAMLDALAAIEQQEGRLRIDAVKALEIRIGQGADRICNIAAPATGLEAKFSLRALAIMRLMGVDLADPAVFGDEAFAALGTGRYFDRVRVVPMAGWPTTYTQVAITVGRRTIDYRKDGADRPGNAEEALAMVSRKFRSLAPGVVGTDRAAALHDLIRGLEQADDLSALPSLAAAAGAPRVAAETAHVA